MFPSLAQRALPACGRVSIKQLGQPVSRRRAATAGRRRLPIPMVLSRRAPYPLAPPAQLQETGLMYLPWLLRACSISAIEKRGLQATASARRPCTKAPGSRHCRANFDAAQNQADAGPSRFHLDEHCHANGRATTLEARTVRAPRAEARWGSLPATAPVAHPMGSNVPEPPLPWRLPAAPAWLVPWRAELPSRL